MRIGILGAGRMADALGTQWARAGHDLMLSGRDPDRAAAAAARIGPDTRCGTWAEAAAYGEVVLLAIREYAVFDVLEAVGAANGTLRGKVVVDCTNPVVDGGYTLTLDPGPSMAERVAEAAVGSRVVKAFSLCHEDVWRMTPPVFDRAPLLVPLSGNDPEALATVAGLAEALGCQSVEVGGLERARLVEAVAALVIGLWVGGADAQAILPPLKYAMGAPA